MPPMPLHGKRDATFLCFAFRQFLCRLFFVFLLQIACSLFILLTAFSN